MTCAYCDEPILPGDRDPFTSGGGQPFHRECIVRVTAGSAAHQLGECPCFGGTRGDPLGMIDAYERCRGNPFDLCRDGMVLLFLAVLPAQAKKVRLAKLSICPCGFPLLNEDITLGQEYMIWPGTSRGGWMLDCGGCGKTRGPFTVVQASQLLHPERHPAPLPIEIFAEDFDDAQAATGAEASRQ